MEIEKIRNANKALNELAESGKDLHSALKNTTRQVAATRNFGVKVTSIG